MNHIDKIHIHDYKTALKMAEQGEETVDSILFGYCERRPEIRDDNNPQVTLQIIDGAHNVLGAVNLIAD